MTAYDLDYELIATTITESHDRALEATFTCDQHGYTCMCGRFFLTRIAAINCHGRRKPSAQQFLEVA